MLNITPNKEATSLKATKAVLIRNLEGKRNILGFFLLFSRLKKIYECVMLELPDKGNQHNISCIPKGDSYILAPLSTDHRVARNTGKKVLEIRNVKGRSGCWIHAGNDTDDTCGCQLPGFSYADIDDDPELEVTRSIDAMNGILELVTEPIPYIII